MAYELGNKWEYDILSAFKRNLYLFFTFVLNHSKLQKAKTILSYQLSITLYLWGKRSLNEIHFNNPFEALDSDLYLCFYDRQS